MSSCSEGTSEILPFALGGFLPYFPMRSVRFFHDYRYCRLIHCIQGSNLLLSVRSFAAQRVEFDTMSLMSFAKSRSANALTVECA